MQLIYPFLFDADLLEKFLFSLLIHLVALSSGPRCEPKYGESKGSAKNRSASKWATLFDNFIPLCW